ncbi:hypothetical protein A0H81_10192 [Grifola frondosa]|uniref:MYND-type domain-containing protein n=1 Tax=Grifola frondosa TaxID=5627 RepID=A0A1C7LYD7_GRIFR|nr:hypothetical protein A0H81_10192 [Grifola frondosa]
MEAETEAPYRGGMEGADAIKLLDWFTPDSKCRVRPREYLRKEFIQCQNCFKSRGSGVTLSRCAGCQIELYCSRACQKAAWKSHKKKCMLNQEALAEMGGMQTALKALRGFTSKHRPTLAQAGMHALDACADPTRAQNYVFVVYLRRRADSRRAETAYYALGAAAVPFDAFPKLQAEEMRRQLRVAHELNVSDGCMGALDVIMLCIDEGIFNIVPVGFDPDTPLARLGASDWRHWLLKRLNEGIVS